MHFTFIEPTWNYDIHCMAEPLGILYLASVLRNEGHDVSLIHTLYRELDVDVITRSDAIGFYSSTPQFDTTLTLFKRVHAMAPLTPIVLGGPHATVMTEDALRAGFHAVFVGEAEVSLPSFLRLLEEGRPLDTPGIAYMADGRMVTNPPAPIIEDIDTIPFPARDLFDYDTYFRLGGWDFGLLGSRGCVYECTFCQPTINHLFRSHRSRSAGNVAREMASILSRYSPPTLYFKDDTMAANGVDWFKDLRRELDALGVKPYPWRCNNRVDRCAPELLDAMAAAGCTTMALGVESGSQRILDFYHKKTRVEDAVDAFRSCRAAGIEPSANIVLGAPIETREDLEATLDLIVKLQPTDYYVFTLTAMPCKFVTDFVKEHGLFKTGMGYHMSDTAINGIRAESNIRHMHITLDDIAEIRDRIFAAFPQRQYWMSEAFKKFGYVPTPNEVWRLAEERDWRTGPMATVERPAASESARETRPEAAGPEALSG
jgi:radical SAM superfamily enzyme YgiQ (UPF0313 family)